MVVKMKFKSLKTLILLNFFLLTACFSEINVSKEEIINQIKNENYPSAVISLKNHIKSGDTDYELRLLLGEIYLKQGNLLGAEKEYLRANELGASVNEFLPPYFKINYFLNNPALIINEWESNQNNTLFNSTEESVVIVALSYLEENNIEQATLILEEFKVNNTTDNISLLEETQNYIKNRSFNTNNLSILVNNHPKEILPLFLLAKSYEQHKEYEKSARTYEQLAQIQSTRDTIKIYIADNYIKAKKFEKAHDFISELLIKYPNNSAVNLLQAHIYLQNKEYELAKKHAEITKVQTQSSIQAYMITGISNYHLQNYEIALEDLQFVEKNIEGNNPTKRLLIATQIELGQSENITYNIASLKNHSIIDGELIAKASYDLIQKGKNKDALDLIQSLPEQYITSTQTKQKFSLLKLGLGNEEGFKELKALADLTSSDNKTKIIYAASLIASQKFEEAKHSLEEWLAHKKTNQPLNLLLAQAEAGLGNSAKAILIYKDELKRQTVPNTRLELALAQEYIKVEQYQNAQKLFDKIVTDNEYNEAAILGYAYVSHFTHSYDTSIQKIENILTGENVSPDKTITLAKVYALSRDPLKIIKLLTANIISGNDNQKSEQWLMLGDAYLAIGLHKLAAESFSNLPATIQSSKPMEMKYFKLYEKSQEYKKALSLINKRFPKNTDTQYKLLQIHFQTLNNQAALALKNIDKLSLSEKQLPALNGLKGRALLRNKQENDALPFLQKDYDIYPSSSNALTLFRAIIKVKGKDEAKAHLKRHLDTIPTDEASRMIYATLLDNRNEVIKQYKILAKSQVENFIVLNNLAWALYEQKKYKEAKKYADRAYKVAPNHKSVINTKSKIDEALKVKE